MKYNLNDSPLSIHELAPKKFFNYGILTVNNASVLFVFFPLQNWKVSVALDLMNCLILISLEAPLKNSLLNQISGKKFLVKVVVICVVNHYTNFK